MKTNRTNTSKRNAVIIALLIALSALLSACDEPVGNNGQSCIGQATTCLYEVVTGK